MSLYLSIEQMAMAASLVIVAMAISTWLRLGLTQNLFVGAIRACVQLTVMGYVLGFVFESTNVDNHVELFAAIVICPLCFCNFCRCCTCSQREADYCADVYICVF